jgi:predicted extracellular nuclease
VIANHFNSKGGDDPLMGRFQPPVLDSEPQRVQQALSEKAFIQQALALDPQARIVSLGDFNDFEFSAPIRTLTGEAAGSQVLFGLPRACFRRRSATATSSRATRRSSTTSS